MIARIPAPPLWTLAALTVATLGMSAGPVIWRLSGNVGNVRAGSSSLQPVETSRVDLTPVLAFSPFGSSVVELSDKAVEGETSLGLTLLGVTISVPANGSRAIIAGGDGPPRSYFVNEIVIASVSLESIEPDHVVLNVDGRLETLSFVKRGGAVSAAKGGPNLRNLIPAANQTNATETTSNDSDDVIARYRAAIDMDAQGVMNRLGLEITDQGYRITESASAGVRQAGFKAGDVVTTVNGKKVGDIAADQGYFDEVAAEGRARVELLRDGQTIVMSFPLR